MCCNRFGLRHNFKVYYFAMLIFSTLQFAMSTLQFAMSTLQFAMSTLQFPTKSTFSRPSKFSRRVNLVGKFSR